MHESHIIQWAGYKAAQAQWEWTFADWQQALTIDEDFRLANAAKDWFCYYA